jgi:transcriptional regulator with XRE-family HTH domain
MGAPQSTAFAALLRRFRRETGMTQAELAEKAGLSTEAVSALERGINRTPRRETVDLLSEALNLDEHNRVLFEQAARRRVSLASSSTPEPASERPAALVGRAQELSLIERLLSGHSTPVLLFSGEPGVGGNRPRGRLRLDRPLW